MHTKKKEIKDKSMDPEKLFDSIPIATFIIDEKVNIVHQNSAAELLFDRSSSDILSLRIGNALKCIHQFDVKKGCGHGVPCQHCTLFGQLSHAIKNGGTIDDTEIEMEVLRKEQPEIIWFYVQVNPVHWEEKTYWIVTLNDITKYKQTERSLKASENKLQGIFDNLQDAFFQADLAGLFTMASPAALQMYRFESLEQLIGTPATSLYANPSDREKLKSELLLKGKIEDFICKGQRSDNSTFWASMNVQFIYDKDGKISGTEGVVRDITVHYQNEAKLRKSNREYAVISQLNQAILHKKEKIQLFEEICYGAIKLGKYSMAWIGLTDEQTQSIKSVAFCGHDEGYLSIITENSEPIGTVIRTEEMVICQNYNTDDSVELWREEAIKRGFQSSISLPIRESGKVIGAFTLYAAEPNFFDQAEIELLDGVVGEMNFALDTIELEQKHKQAALALANKELQYRLLFENMPSGYALYEVLFDEKGHPIDHRLLEANKEFNTQTGLRREEEIGRISTELSFEWPKEVTERFYQVGISGDGLNFHRYNDSIKRYFDIRVSSPRKGQYALLFNDITESKLAQEKLKESQTLLRSIVDSTDDMIWTVDAEKFGLLDWNPSFEKYFSEKRGIPIRVGDCPEDLFPEGAPFIKLWNDYFNQAKNTGSFFTEYSSYSKDLSFLLTLNLLKQGDLTFGISIFAKNISEIRAVEAEAIRNRNHFKTMFEEAPLGIALVDSLNGRFCEVNEKLVQITGRTKDALLNIDYMGITHPEDVEDLLHQMSRLISGEIKGCKMEKRFIKSDGNCCWMNLTFAPIQVKDSTQPRHLAMIEDISERKANEEKVRILSETVEQSPFMILITDDKQRIEYVNKQFTTFTQFSPEEIIGKLPCIFNPLNWSEEHFCSMWKNLKKGEFWQIEGINHKKDQSPFWEKVKVFPLFDEQNAVTKYIIIKDDITESKKVEEALIQSKEKAEESDRLKTAFLANISHEIRTPLNGIIGFSNLLLDSTFEKKQQDSFIETILYSCNNLLMIINDIMDLSKIESGQVSIYNVSFSVKDLLTEIENEQRPHCQRKNLEFKISCPPMDRALVGDKVKIKQILTNFSNNAIKFTETGTIEIGYAPLNDSIQFFVKDSGIGIHPEHQEKIFERFWQVDPSYTRIYGGNGLGLTIAKQFAERMGGEVTLKSNIGEGSTFFLTIPTP